MHQFLNCSDDQWDDLERRARTAAYINFPDTELPPACVPQNARVGLQINDVTGVTKFFIERGVKYYGANPRIQLWIEQAEISFRNYKEFRCWISSDIANEFSRFEKPGTLSTTSAQPLDKLTARTGDQNASSVGINVSPSQAAISDLRQKFPPPDVSKADPVANKLIGFLVRQIARSYSVEVEAIDAALFAQVHSKLLAVIDQTTCDTVIDDLLGGPFALASVEGHRRVSLQAGPPITCKPISGSQS